MQRKLRKDLHVPEHQFIRLLGASCGLGRELDPIAFFCLSRAQAAARRRRICRPAASGRFPLSLGRTCEHHGRRSTGGSRSLRFLALSFSNASLKPGNNAVTGTRPILLRRRSHDHQGDDVACDQSHENPDQSPDHLTLLLAAIAIIRAAARPRSRPYFATLMSL